MRHICVLPLLAAVLAAALVGCGGGGGGGGGNGNIDEVSIAVSPKNAGNSPSNPLDLPSMSTQTFTAIVTGTSDTTVAWFVNDVQQGGTSVSGNTFLFVPSATGLYTVRAVSNADPTKSDSVVVQVGPPGPPG